MISDQAQRQRALDPGQSFIVQAPAGSGKTELLIQRYLVLLALVDDPEEIIAITFTRKAAREMKNRVLDALLIARAQSQPETDHERKTFLLAQAALARNDQRHWNILEQSGRIKIKTIDSFCADLSRQMPVLSRFGSPPALSEDSETLYRAASRTTINELEGGNEWSGALRTLVSHLDNNLVDFENLIVGMLERRDQWLRHVASDEVTQRHRLESDIHFLVQQEIDTLKGLIPDSLLTELVQLLAYCCKNIRDQEDHSLYCCLEISTPDDIKTVVHWRAISDWLMSKKGDWRTRPNKNQGLPAANGSKEEKEESRKAKEQFGRLIESLDRIPELRERLFKAQLLPEISYTDEQWQVLKALFDVLRLSVAMLELEFQSRNQVDFTAMAQSALQALGEEEAPTELALALDYRIQHILVDEFQDTSFLQFELLERLTLGWQPNDGRTLFCVGDPMQSIYRFREAEVGLYLKAKKYGIGNVKLNPLTLEVNFRSQEDIVNWINDGFAEVLAKENQMEEGAVSYTASTAFNPPIEQQAVYVYPQFGKDRLVEADQVFQTINKLKANFPDDSIAILVRSRGHLLEIVPRLKRGGLLFQAIDIEPLAHRPVVRDLISITHGLLHFADRVSWLALLRAPWCGLSLHDLHALLGEDRQGTVWTAINHKERLEQLGKEQQQRVKRLRDAYSNAQRHKGSRLRQRVESIWMEVGGPACVNDETDIQDALVYLDLLDRLEHGDVPLDRQTLAKEVGRLSALPDVNADGNLKILTIHKAKGLEFDHVIIPGLGHPGPVGQRSLLKWTEFARADGLDGLLLAPIRERSDNTESLYQFIGDMERKKERYELGRLFYVAATRARKSLHWFGHVDMKEHRDQTENNVSIKDPAANCPLYIMWPALKKYFESSLVNQSEKKQQSTEPESRDILAPGHIRRLKQEWSLPKPPPSASFIKDPFIVEPDIQTEEIEFSWAGETARQIGVVTHLCLQKAVKDGLDFSVREIQERQRNYIGMLLKQEGVKPDDYEKALAQTLQNLKSTCEDERGRWILNPDHGESRCEYALSGIYNNRLVNIVIDRTFVDEDGIRWIIDYKTGTHKGSGLKAFLDREKERYQGQLELYARLMRQMDQQPIRVALYYPYMKGWREWEVQV